MSAAQRITRPRRRPWTPERIRRTIALPKPQGAVALAAAYDAGTTWRRDAPTVTLAEVLLQQLGAHLDIVANGPVPTAAGRVVPGVWVLLPIPDRLLDMLAELGAELEDLEDGADAELGNDRERDDACAEPSLGQPESHTTGLWADHGAMDREEDDCAAADDSEGEPNVVGTVHMSGADVSVLDFQAMAPVYEAAAD